MLQGIFDAGIIPINFKVALQMPSLLSADGAHRLLTHLIIGNDFGGFYNF